MKVPLVAGDIIKIVVWIEHSTLVDDMCLTFDVRYKQLRFLGKSWVNTIYGTIPVRWRLLRYMPFCNLVLASFQIRFELRELIKINEASVIRKRIDNSEAALLHISCQDVACHHKWQLAI